MQCPIDGRQDLAYDVVSVMILYICGKVILRTWCSGDEAGGRYERSESEEVTHGMMREVRDEFEKILG